MKKALISLIAIIFLIACDNKNKSDKSRNIGNREKDDYRSGVKNPDRDEETNDKRNADYKNENDKEDEKTESFSGGGWPSSEIESFLTECESSAVKNGMQKSKARDYCDCMQQKMEKLYPDIEDAGKIPESEMEKLVTRLAPGCVSKK